VPKRRDSSVPRVEWKISLPAVTAARLEQRLYSPHQRKPSYGARSQLLETLINDYLTKVEAAENDRG
jgi:hypothetical protein